ncbi:MAG: hypothetical protein GWN71_43430, partial [Gammaproteobacteria bacterium]|nr:hypothetical protein [Gemmatimonadota bacterium]NIU80144.1 hypothetical protein [Gammaproteobacteria bacterium]
RAAPELFADAEAGLAVRYKVPDATTGEEVHCGAYERLRERERRLDRAEAKRIWYVATTRARDLLVLCATP